MNEHEIVEVADLPVPVLVDGKTIYMRPGFVTLAAALTVALGHPSSALVRRAAAQLLVR